MASSQAKASCVLVTCFDKNQPGYLDFSYRIKALAKQYQLTVISQTPITQSELLIKDADYVVIPILDGKIGWIKYLLECAGFIKKQKPDIVILLHSALAPITLFAGSLPTCLYWNEHPTNLMHMPVGFSPIKKVLTWFCHEFIFKGAKRASMVLPIGEEHQEDLISRGVSSNKIELQYMGVDEQFVKPPQTINKIKDSRKLMLVYIGTVSVSRGLDVMLEAMQLVLTNKQNFNVFLSIVGASNEELMACRQKTLKLGLDGHVDIIGRVPGNEVFKYFHGADAGICIWAPNRWNMFNPPTKLFEYLVAGLPVLASNICTHTRYIEHGKTGFIFDYSATALAHAITKLNKDIGNLDNLKKQASHEGEKYLWNKIEPAFMTSIAKVHGYELN